MESTKVPRLFLSLFSEGMDTTHLVIPLCISDSGYYKYKVHNIVKQMNTYKDMIVFIVNANSF